MSYKEQEGSNTPQVKEPDLGGTYTAADYLSWHVEELVELIRGKIFKMSPSPRVSHQSILGILHLKTAVPKLENGCKVFLSPLDVYLVNPGEDYKQTPNVVEPDLFIVCDQSKMQEFGCVGAPDFIVEILSPSTRKKDATLKLELYQEYGVPEYWMISPLERMVLINILDENGRYQLKQPAVEGQVISPKNFPEIQVEVEDLFKDVPEV